MFTDLFTNQRNVMRTEVKGELLALLMQDADAMVLYRQNEGAVRLAIEAACREFVKPTRRKAVISAIAQKILAGLKGGTIRQRYYA